MNRRIVSILVVSLLLISACAEFGSQGPIVIEEDLDVTTDDQDQASNFQIPTSRSGGTSGLIAYIGSDGNLYTIDQSGADEIAITDDAVLPNGSQDANVTRIYLWPTWAKTEQKLAYYQREFQSQNQERINKIWVSDGDGSDQSVLFEAPYAPIYYDWSPDSTTLGVLNGSQMQQFFQMQIFPEGGEMQVLDVGSPLFWDWSPHSQQIIMHLGRGNTNEKLSLFTLADNSGADLGSQPIVEEVIDVDYGNFDTPDWSPDGNSLLFARRSVTPGDDDTLIVSRDLATREDDVIAKYDGAIQVAASYSPDGSQVAFIPSAAETANLPSGELFVADLASGEEVKSSNRDIVSYFWSPDGRKIAYFAFYYAPILDGDGEPTGRRAQNPSGIAVYVFDIEQGTDTLIIEAVQPTPPFNQVLAFHDQYQHAVSIWSPDSQNLVLSYQVEGDSVIAVAGIDGQSPPDVIADGELAFWSRQ